MRNLPPGSIGPASMEALDLEIDSDLSSFLPPEGHCLAKFPSQFSIGAFKQRGGTYPLTGIGHRRLVGMIWRRIPSAGLDRLAQWASQIDLSSPSPGGGRLIVARKRC